MRGRLGIFLTLLSAVLLCTTVAVWVRSDRDFTVRPRGAFDFVTWQRGTQRFTVRSERGRLGMFVPPRPQTGSRSPFTALSNLPSSFFTRQKDDSEATVARLLSELRNEQIMWMDSPSPAAMMPVARSTLPSVFPMPVGQTPAIDLQDLIFDIPTARIGTHGILLRLLDALDDPRQFVAAHVLLTDKRGSLFPATGQALPSGWSPMTYNGLKLDVNPVPPALGPSSDAMDSGQFISSSPWGGTAYQTRIDLGQLPLIRDQWHRVFDVQTWSIHYGWITFTTSLLPALWIGRRWRDALQRRRLWLQGRCRRCGYDLRATTSGICPECGMPFKVEPGEEKLDPRSGASDPVTECFRSRKE